MTDVCLSCTLPGCDDTDPRCGWRQTPEFQHLRALRQAQNKRKWERELRRREQQARLEANKADLEKRAKINRCKILWQEGRDTFEIADRLGVPEALVYNEILPAARAA